MLHVCKILAMLSLVHMNHETGTLNKAERDNKAGSIDFIYSDHSLENLPKIAEALINSDGDIIAIEKIREGSFGMGTAEEKAELSRRMTEFLSSKSNITQSASEYLDTNEPLFTALLDRLKGSDKRIVIIDMGTDDPGYAYYRRSVELRLRYAEMIDELERGANISEAELDNLEMDYKIAMAQCYEYREHVMEGQLRALTEENPEAKITVMMGASHTPVSHNMKSNFDTSRNFVPTDEDEALYPKGVKMDFGASSEIRSIRFRLGEFGLSVVDQPGDIEEKEN